MALRNSHRYVAEASDRKGRRLGALALAPDFAPAAEWSHLQAVRCGALEATAHHGPGVIEPVFDPARGHPYIEGIRVRFDAADPAYETPEIPWSYFQQWVEGSATQLVRDARLRAGESFVYRICAFPLDRDHRPPAAASFTVADVTPAPLVLETTPLTERLARAVRLGQAAWSDTDFPVFVQPAVLDEATEMAHGAGARETGGILVGHLRRDSGTPELLAEITAQIPATHADAGHSHLGFTAETWSAVSDALALRRRNEILLGWWHSHPFFCRRCDPVRRSHCMLARPFFSRDDCELHRTVFDTAFSVALLLSDVGEESLRYDWFGWRYGSIAARGCYLMPSNGPSTFKLQTVDGVTPVARVLPIQEKTHEY